MRVGPAYSSANDRFVFGGSKRSPVNHVSVFNFVSAGRDVIHVGRAPNGRLRDEGLNVTEFMSIEHAKAHIEAWRVDYNEHRPHGALGHLTPSEYANRGQRTAFGAADF